MFDSHTHLNNAQLYTNRQQHLSDFFQAGGVGLVNIGVNHDYNTKGIQICKSLHENDTSPVLGATSKSGRYPKASYSTEIKIDKNLSLVYCTIGLHPYEVVSGDIIESNLQLKLREMCSLYSPYKKFIVGIGECGIDTHEE